MVGKEEYKHEGDDGAENNDSYERVLRLVKVLKDDPFVCLELLPRHRRERLFQKPVLFDEVHQDVIACVDTVQADDRVQEKEGDEVLVVV